MEIVLQNTDTVSAMDILKIQIQLEKIKKDLTVYTKLYRTELKDLQCKVHRSKDGVMLISDMTDDHLINTALLCDRNDYDDERYLAEIKARGLTQTYISRLKQQWAEVDEDDLVLLDNPY